MGFKNNLLNWLSSGGAYWLIAALWLICAVVFARRAKHAGADDGNANNGCYLTISTTVFVAFGGAIGLWLFKDFFPWYILTSLAGAIIAPTLVIKKFKSGKRKY